MKALLIIPVRAIFLLFVCCCQPCICLMCGLCMSRIWAKSKCKSYLHACNFYFTWCNDDDYILTQYVERS